jgi:hypothetical protein
VRRDQILNFFVRQLSDRGERLIGRADIEVENEHAFVGDDEIRIARAGGILHEINAICELGHRHLDLSRCGVGKEKEEKDKTADDKTFHDRVSFA